MDASRITDVKPRAADVTERIIGWKLAEVLDSSQLSTLKLPDPMAASKVSVHEQMI